MIVSAIGLLGAALTILIPNIMFQILQNNVSRFKDPKWLQRNEQLIESTRVQDGRFLCQFSIPLFYFRRLLYLSILMILKNYPSIQLALCCLTTGLQLLYYALVLPYNSVTRNVVTIVTETLTGISFAYAYNFKRPILDEAKWEADGWIMIYLALSVLGLHLSVVIIQGGVSFYKVSKSLYKSIKEYCQKTYLKKTLIDTTLKLNLKQLVQNQEFERQRSLNNNNRRQSQKFAPQYWSSVERLNSEQFQKTSKQNFQSIESTFNDSIISDANLLEQSVNHEKSIAKRIINEQQTQRHADRELYWQEISNKIKLNIEKNKTELNNSGTFNKDQKEGIEEEDKINPSRRRKGQKVVNSIIYQYQRYYGKNKKNL